MDEKLLYLFAAYTIIWLAVFAYSFSLSSRQKALQREIEALREALTVPEEAARVR
ncbi:MAG: CcmD family protein [Chloroflexi bacterium]|nr:CcmD family protein [Chloroflexota bacterium]